MYVVVTIHNFQREMLTTFKPATFGKYLLTIYINSWYSLFVQEIRTDS